MTTFVEHLHQALEHYTDPVWIGSHSPLATPYILGDHLGLTDYPETARGRGVVVQTILLQALALLNDITLSDLQWMSREELQDIVQRGSREQKLIYWRFMHHVKLPVNVLIDHLNVARATFHRDMKERLPSILETLARGVLQLLRPALRPEPIPQVEQFFRREVFLAHIKAILHSESCGIIGPIGSGKTVIAAQLAADWDGIVAWVTLRTGLNDYTNSLFFSLAAVFHEHGASSLWLQLLADGENINRTIALGLLRSDCLQLSESGLFICLDGADVLADSRASGLCSLVQVISELPHTTILTLSTKDLNLFEQHILVPPLPQAEVIAWGQLWDITLSELDAKRIEAFTRGHVQLTALALIYVQQSLSLITALKTLAQASSVDRIIDRLLDDLPAQDYYLLQLLAVLHTSTPQNMWPKEKLEALIESKMVLCGSNETVFLGGLVRQRINERLTDKDRELAERHAAELYLALGQFSLAAHHLIAAGEPLRAFYEWVPHRQQELRDGQAYAALNIFDQINPADWSIRDRDALMTIRAELRRLLGEQGIALQELERISGSSDLATYIFQLRGEMWETQGQVERSKAAYERALKLLGGMPQRQITSLHTRIGSLYLNHERELDLAQREAWSARYSAELFSGEVAEELIEYAQALGFYTQALTLAEQLRDPLRQGRVHFNLGSLATKREQSQTALHHFQKAVDFYSVCGDLVRVARTRSNMAALYIIGREYESALPIAKLAYEFFERMQAPYWMALNAVNLGEAHWGLGLLDEAELWVERALMAEETSLMPYALTTLGNVRLDQDRWPDAEQLFQQAINLADQNQDRFAEAPAWHHLGRLYQQQQHPQEAQQALSKALDLFTSLEMAYEVKQVKQLLSQV